MGAATLFTGQPDRLAAAWRRERYTETPAGTSTQNLLDNVVEEFIRQIGRTLSGAVGSPWSRTRGVLRISVARGTTALIEEFGTLRRCLVDAMRVVGAEERDERVVEKAIEEAAECAVAYWRRLHNPMMPRSRAHFGGLVVEIVEPQPPMHASTRAGAAVSIH